MVAGSIRIAQQGFPGHRRTRTYSSSAASASRICCLVASARLRTSASALRCCCSPERPRGSGPCAAQQRQRAVSRAASWALAGRGGYTVGRGRLAQQPSLFPSAPSPELGLPQRCSGCPWMAKAGPADKQRCQTPLLCSPEAPLCSVSISGGTIGSPPLPWPSARSQKPARWCRSITVGQLPVVCAYVVQ